jgi:hypothetical protein
MFNNIRADPVRPVTAKTAMLRNRFVADMASAVVAHAAPAARSRPSVSNF